MVCNAKGEHVAFDAVFAAELVAGTKHLAVKGYTESELSEAEFKPHVKGEVDGAGGVFCGIKIVDVCERHGFELVKGKSHTRTYENVEVKLRCGVEVVIQLCRYDDVVLPIRRVVYPYRSLGVLAAQVGEGVLREHRHVHGHTCTQAELFNYVDVVASLDMATVHKDSCFVGAFHDQAIAAMHVELGDGGSRDHCEYE